ncbi:hypothetical protein HCN44_002602 [Aphidius gifuensis]|uniref:Uncharacterized protein n=1 Tax=Aphidius gifuensis TaxID=684658 RepID=A0A834Y1J1_APHGI|nr:piwi-like protein Siwi [Aphidius gifuensis]KAF7996956.1 hypothetical protein HCN44_002602 [Aphidius gifuensis]
MESGRGRSRGRARGIRPQQNLVTPGPPEQQQQSSLGPIHGSTSSLPGLWAAPYARRPGPPAESIGQTLSSHLTTAPPVGVPPVVTTNLPQELPQRQGGRGVPRPATNVEVREPYFAALATSAPRESSSTVPDRVAPRPSSDVAPAKPVRSARRDNRAPEINTRPAQWSESKKGTSGKQVTLRANYFKLAAAPTWCLYQYHVDFQPEEDRIFVRKGLLNLHKTVLGGYMFDGKSLFLASRLPSDITELSSLRQSDGVHIRVIIKMTGTLERGDGHYLQFYNILMRKCLAHLQLQLVGRNYFDPIAKVAIHEHNFELWPGYITSIRQHERDLMMCCEITHKVMRQEKLFNIMTRIRNDHGANFQAACKAEVIGITVLTDYNNNTYRVEDIDFQTTPLSTFHLKKEDRDVSYADYYRNKYNIKIEHVTQPMLITRSSDKNRQDSTDTIVYLVPELCRATGITDAMRNDYKLMDAMAQHTRISAETRVKKLNVFNQRLHGEPKVVTEFREWQLELERQLVSIPARVLGETKVFFANQIAIGAGQNADWTNAFRNNGLIEPVSLTDWVVIVPDKLMDQCRDFVRIMQRSLKNLPIRDPNYVKIRNDSAQSFTGELENILSHKNPQLILCVIFKQRGDIYSAIKKKCCIDRPVPCQIVTSKCFNPKRMMSIATKVAIQMNCKIGGFPWSCSIPLNGLMVIGYDVCHDTNQRGKDFGAMVASLDKRLGRYYSAVSSHQSSEQLTSELILNINKAVQKYREINSALPEKIIIYRDGVGDGQVAHIFQHEVVNIKDSLAQVYGRSPDDVPMAYVIVTKRLNTRLFADNRGRISNPEPGTIVDDVITNPTKYDFYVVAQSIRQGSVAPTSFSVVHDNVGLDPDKMQMLTYRLMHMYFNWSGTVKVPAPVQFAQKLAFLVSQSIHITPNAQLETLLYYL